MSRQRRPSSSSTLLGMFVLVIGAAVLCSLIADVHRQWFVVVSIVSVLFLVASAMNKKPAQEKTTKTNGK